MGKGFRFETVAEYNSQITLLNDAITRIAILGEETGNNSGGSQRDNREARIDLINSQIEVLVEERDRLDPNSASSTDTPVNLIPGW